MSKPLILCVDDEIIVLNSLEIELHNTFGHQYSYEFAENADEALEIISEFEDSQSEIVLIVSDWLMPGKKGDEFFKIVHKKHPNIVKIMLTGQASDEAIEDAKQQVNLYACIRKPWSKNQLMELIKTALTQNNKI